ncbi:BnaC04g19660D [Brassica napus]|uniref:DUF659 domain-containing protein n=2 Tax=Brassica TaxID=3705 RepID=A0A3P6CKQ0_BRAOL|nr:unnamed protein product [Brassica napus]CDY08657.1 BnaC04g19660D [Brassica napus]VDD08952.1 unnamed protein product [Brassica oleracea]
MFSSSKDTPKDSHTGDYIFQYIDQWSEDIGSERIVQVVTNNATNNVAAAKMLKEKRPKIFWTGCTAHTLDLMLEGISKLQYFSKIIEQAKAVTIFVYAHHKTLSLMRFFTKNHDIVRPGATSVMVVLKIFSPLVKVLRLADGEKVPSLDFIYCEILEAKNSIKEASNYGPIFHSTIKSDFEVMEGFIACVETFYHGDLEKQDRVVNHELSLYKNKIGSFGRTLAFKGCENKDSEFDPDNDYIEDKLFTSTQEP